MARRFGGNEASFYVLAIRTQNLTKKFKDLVAVAHVSLGIERGECFGLLGPNGAGKTSVIRMITAVSPPTDGEIWVLGEDLKARARKVKAVLGVVPQHDNLDPDLSVFQNLITFARYFDIPGKEARRRSIEVLELVQLGDRRDSRVEELSGGMRRRLLIARALINAPKLIVLDEPTVGLDPQAKYLVWHKLKELKSLGVTQLLSTQNMEEATALCDRVAIMHQGKVLDVAAPEALISKYVGRRIWEIEVEPEQKVETLQRLKDSGLELEEVGDAIHIFHAESDESIRSLVGSLKGFRRRAGTLEDVFLKLTGRSLAE